MTLICDETQCTWHCPLESVFLIRTFSSHRSCDPTFLVANMFFTQYRRKHTDINNHFQCNLPLGKFSMKHKNVKDFSAVSACPYVHIFQLWSTRGQDIRQCSGLLSCITRAKHAMFHMKVVEDNLHVRNTSFFHRSFCFRKKQT
jgi:hypothetical protein